MDGEVRGFGVRRQGDGPAFYFLRYRAGKGRSAPSRWMTIGRDGSPWVPETARKEAKRLLGLVAAGQDPARAPEAHRRAISVGDMCDRYLVAAPSLVLPGKGRPKKPRSIETDRSNINRHVKPLLGRRRADELRPIDIEHFQRDVAAGKTAAEEKTRKRGLARVTGGAGIASRVIAVLGAVYSWAIRENIVTENPVRGISKYKPVKKERFLSAEELKRLGDVLTAAESGGPTMEGGNDPDSRSTENPVAIAAIRILIFTGARKMEILGARWKWVDLERGVLRLPDSKTGAKTVVLTAPARKILAKLPREKDNPFVFPGAKEKSHLVGLPRVWSRIKKRAGLTDVRLHDLRHSFASFAVSDGSSLFLLGKVLGHAQSKTTEKYAHLADDPVRAVADRTANRIEAAISGSEAIVVPFKAAHNG
jgi:integrase